MRSDLIPLQGDAIPVQRNLIPCMRYVKQFNDHGDPAGQSVIFLADYLKDKLFEPMPVRFPACSTADFRFQNGELPKDQGNRRPRLI
jgi:hypothetical protein